MSLSPIQIREIVEQYLDILYPGSRGIQITFLVKNVQPDFWKINVSFKKRAGDIWSYTAMIKMEPDGAITEFKEGWYWKF